VGTITTTVEITITIEGTTTVEASPITLIKAEVAAASISEAGSIKEGLDSISLSAMRSSSPCTRRVTGLR
jgi:hypothetical protein